MAKPRKVDWSAGDWLNGTRRLTNEQRGVYVTVCCLIYDIGGPVSRQEINRECVGHSKSTKRIVDSLLEIGKLVVTDDGLLDQPRCEIELSIARKRLDSFRDRARNNGSLGGRPAKEINDLEKPNRARSKGEAKDKDSDIKNLEGDAGRSAPAREGAQDVRPPPTEEEKAEVAALVEQTKAALTGTVPKGIRDPAAHKAAVTDSKFRAVYRAVNEAVSARLDGTAREEAWRVVAAAQEAGSWAAMSKPDRKALRALWQWSETLEEPEPLQEAAD